MNDIVLDTGVEVHDAVAADAPVENAKTVNRPCLQEFGCGHHGVALAKATKIVGDAGGITTAVAISDGIALEENSAVAWYHGLYFFEQFIQGLMDYGVLSSGRNQILKGSYVVDGVLMRYNPLISNEEQIFKRRAYF
jgi:hypothetical protein